MFLGRSPCWGSSCSLLTIIVPLFSTYEKSIFFEQLNCLADRIEGRNQNKDKRECITGHSYNFKSNIRNIEFEKLLCVISKPNNLNLKAATFSAETKLANFLVASLLSTPKYKTKQM